MDHEGTTDGQYGTVASVRQMNTTDVNGSNGSAVMDGCGKVEGSDTKPSPPDSVHNSQEVSKRRGRSPVSKTRKYRRKVHHKAVATQRGFQEKS